MTSIPTPTGATAPTPAKDPRTQSHWQNTWFYPHDLENDLSGIPLPYATKQEIFACAWEYARCVIPSFTSWRRYLAFIRLIIVGTIAEFRGDLISISTDPVNVLGYNLDRVVWDLFGGSRHLTAMSREVRTFLLICPIKTSVAKRTNSHLYHRYVAALTASPAQWFRMRDCDGGARFTMAAALVCNDFLDTWFAEPQIRLLNEIGFVMYDGVAYHKHRAEGEIANTFAYAGHELELRQASYARAREVLWALDTAWANDPASHCVINLWRQFGGPIHMEMRRYRFVEDGMMIGRPETEDVVVQTRRNFKLWYRSDAIVPDAAAKHDSPPEGKGMERQAEPAEPRLRVTPEQREEYGRLLAKSEYLMFDGLKEMLESSPITPDKQCKDCDYRVSYGAHETGEFGGVLLCAGCREKWQVYLGGLQARAEAAFPEIAAFWKKQG